MIAHCEPEVIIFTILKRREGGERRTDKQIMQTKNFHIRNHGQVRIS